MEKGGRLVKLQKIQPHYKRSVKQIDKINGETIKVWDSISIAARELKIAMSGIIRCCNKTKHHKTCAGYRWEYEGLPKKII